MSAAAYGVCAIGVMAQAPTPTTGGVVSTAVAPGITAATLQPTIAGGSANLPAGSQSTSGTPRITALLVIAVAALIVLGAGSDACHEPGPPSTTVRSVFKYAAYVGWKTDSRARMRHLTPGAGIVAALKADGLSLTAFEVGLFGWMLLIRFAFFRAHPLHPGEARYSE